MSDLAHVRLRGEGWDIPVDVAARLEAEGVIWHDYDCDQNTIDNGFLNEGPCYGIFGEEDSAEENRNLAIVEWQAALVR